MHHHQTTVIDEHVLYNIRAEQTVLGSVLLDRDVIAELAPILVPQDFFDSSHRLIFEAYVQLWNRRVPTDLITLANELSSMRVSGFDGTALLYIKDPFGDWWAEGYLAELIAVTPTAVHAVHYAKIVLEHAVRRAEIEVAHGIVSNAYDDTLSPQERLSLAEMALKGLTRPDGQVVTADDLMSSMYDDSYEYSGGLLTGITELDSFTGGFHDGQLIVLAARPAVGKSALAGQIAYNVANHGFPVSFVTLEMMAKDVAGRMCALVENINLARIMTSELYRHQHLAELTNAQAQIASLPLHFNTEPVADLATIVSIQTALRARENIRLLIIDYLGLMDDPATSGNETIMLGAITRELKLTAQRLSIPILLVHQLNRNIEYREEGTPTLSDLRGSGKVEQDADVVLFLHRQEPMNPTTTFTLAKNRRGPTGAFDLRFVDYRTMFV